MQDRRRRSGRRGSSVPRWGRSRLVRVLAAGTLGVVLVSCIPEQRGELGQVDRPVDTLAVPDVGDGASSDDLVAGLVADLASVPDDLSYWALSVDEATCVAEQVVDGVGGERLLGLGYRPATPGAALADLELDEQERVAVTDVVVECVDLREAIAQLFFGDGRLPPTVATCMADGLEATGQLRPLAIAVVGGEAIDPFQDGGALAAALLTQSAICIPEDAFNWPQLRLPGGAEVIDADAPPGVSRSPYVGDRPATTTP